MDLWATVGYLLRRFRSVALRFVAVFVAGFFYTTVLPADPLQVTSESVGYLGWIRYSLAVDVVQWLEVTLLPHGEVILALGPFDAFSIIMEVGMLLSLMVALPVLFLDLYYFAAPGLKPAERRFVGKLAGLSSVLFTAGTAFGLFVILPPIYEFSYALQSVVGASGSISLTEFFNTTLVFAGGLGLAFELPTAALLLAYARLLTSQVMREKFWIALILLGVVVTFISPGVGGGIVEGFILITLLGLYYLAYLLVRNYESARTQTMVSPAIAAGG